MTYWHIHKHAMLFYSRGPRSWYDLEYEIGE